MSVYFFDVDDGVHRFDDRAGINLARIEDVPQEAESLLRLLAFEHVQNEKVALFKAVVRNVDGKRVYRATIIAGQGRLVFTSTRMT